MEWSGVEWRIYFVVAELISWERGSAVTGLTGLTAVRASSSQPGVVRTDWPTHGTAAHRYLQIKQSLLHGGVGSHQEAGGGGGRGGRDRLVLWKCVANSTELRSLVWSVYYAVGVSSSILGRNSVNTTLHQIDNTRNLLSCGRGWWVLTAYLYVILCDVNI